MFVSFFRNFTPTKKKYKLKILLRKLKHKWFSGSVRRTAKKVFKSKFTNRILQLFSYGHFEKPLGKLNFPILLKSVCKLKYFCLLKFCIFVQFI